MSGVRSVQKVHLGFPQRSIAPASITCHIVDHPLLLLPSFLTFARILFPFARQSSTTCQALFLPKTELFHDYHGAIWPILMQTIDRFSGPIATTAELPCVPVRPCYCLIKATPLQVDYLWLTRPSGELIRVVGHPDVASYRKTS